ncbi:Deoxyhypusine synthase [Candidatus Magnetomoraceae bacterium gMMP-1]
MSSRFSKLDPNLLKLARLSTRKNNLSLSDIKPIKALTSIKHEFKKAAINIIEASDCNPSIILMMGAHVIRSGVQRYLIDLMEKGYISCIAVNGAGVIHDFEFAMIGATTESVAHYIKDGKFGLWHETGHINDIVSKAAKDNKGLGEAVGRVIEEENFPNKNISILAAGYRLGIPITVHVGIGYDIVHQFPNCEGGAYGAASYTDFLIFAKVLEALEGGVVMNFGSAVMGPEIFLKALSMARNIASQQGKEICHFTTLVCDLVDLPDNYHQEASKDNPFYYFRPWKTMLVRTVADGGESFYVKGYHSETIPQLWSAINELEQ